MSPVDIKQLIESTLQGSLAVIEGDDGRHFQATVISDAFIGKSRVQQQQLVYTSLGQHIHDGTIHAISIKTFTPEQWHSTLSK